MTTNTKNYFPKTNVQKLLNIKQTNLKVQHLFAFFSPFIPGLLVCTTESFFSLRGIPKLSLSV
jgi:hypothetical protein